MKNSKKFLLVVILLLSSYLVDAQRELPSDGVPCAIKITNITVIPAHVDQVYANQDVIIGCGGEIQNISPHQEATEVDSTQLAHFGDNGFSKEIDGTGKFLIAAFSDAHVHLPEKVNLENFFLLNLLNGVTSLRSMRGEDWHLSIDQKDLYTPKLYLSAPPIVDSSFKDLEALQADLNKFKRAGWDFVKLLSVDTSSNYNILQRMAKSAKIKVAGHAPHGVSIESLCNQGNFMSIEHLGGISDLAEMDAIVEGIKMTNKASIYHCPTINWAYSFQFTETELKQNKGVELVSKAVVENWNAELKESAEGRTKEELEQFRTMVAKHSAMMTSYLQFLYQQGGKLLLSPDASGAYNIPGFSYHDEIQHFKKVGMSNREILKIASANMSEMFGEAEEWGTLKVGSETDLLILNSNPLEDISNAQDIDALIMRGQYFSSSSLKDKLLHP